MLFLANMYPLETDHIYSPLGFIRGEENITFIQRSLIEGMERELGHGCSVINKMLVHPRKNKRVIYSEWNHLNQKCINFSYFCLPFFSSNILFLFAKKHIKNWLIEHEKMDKLVVAYGLTNYNLQALAYAKKYSKVKTVLIIPDLPEYTKNNRNSLLLSLKNQLTNFITSLLEKKYLPEIDMLFLFSEKMASKLHRLFDYRIMEGIATDNFSSIIPERLFDKNNYIAFYGGGLHKRYGVDLLIDSLKYIKNDNYYLVICGNGDYVPEIEKMKLYDKRIIYLGVVPRHRFLALQLGSDLLINPRTSNQAFSDYSFPSKNMEFLSSGVPFIGFKLGGIPDEYDRFITYPKDETAQELANSISTFINGNKEGYLAKALEAKEYVLTKKNKYEQARAIIDSVTYQ